MMKSLFASFLRRSPSKTFKSLLLGGGIVGVSQYVANKEKKTDCCGIVAYVGKDPKATEVCLEGVEVLQFRGYDSCGLTTLGEDGQFITTKMASEHHHGGNCIQKIIEQAPAIHGTSRVGIAHTRWATHGPKTDYNAHPHLDAKKRIALVHNGIIDNYKECKAELNSYGIKMNSDTDTELIAQFIGYFLDQGLNLFDSIKATLEGKVHGTWGLAIISILEPDRIYLARNAGTLVVGFHDDFVIASSDVAAFQKYTNNYISVEDNICVVDFKSKAQIDRKKLKICEFQEIDVKPREPYKHFFIQEIMEQPDGLAKTTNYGARFEGFSRVKLGGLELKAAEVASIENLVITSCGTSFYASLFGAFIMKKLQSFNTVQVVDASELIPEDFAPDSPGLLAVSQSGETKDVLNAVKVAKKKGVTCFSIVNKTESELAREIKCGVFLNAGREVSVASTKAFTTQVVVLSLIAIWAIQQKHSEYFMINERMELIQNLRSLSQYASDTLIEVRSVCRDIAVMLKVHEHLFILGKGAGEAIAKEGALKIKEVSYIHAEGFCSGAFKHGPIALTDPDKKTPFILLIFNDDVFENMVATLNQVKGRQATTIVITDCAHKLDKKLIDYLLEVPSCGLLTALLGVLPLQLIAYDCAIVRGLDPDRPRHLAKEQTVQ